MHNLLLYIAWGVGVSVNAMVLTNHQFSVSLDGNSQRIEVVDQRSQMRRHQVSLPSPPVFNAQALAKRPSLKNRAIGWDGSVEMQAVNGNRFSLAWSPEYNELYLQAELSSGWQTGGALEVWIGDSQILLTASDKNGGAALFPERYYETKREPALYGEKTDGGYLFQAVLPMENFISLDNWDETQRFIAAAFNVRWAAGGYSDRWPIGNEPDRLWSFAQVALSTEKASPEGVELFNPKIRNPKQENGRLSFGTTLCAMSRAGAVQVPARVELSLTENGVVQKILPEPVSVPLHDLIWPCAFVLAGTEAWTIYPNDSGMLVPTAVDHPQAVNEAWIYDGLIYDFNGTTSAGLGMVDRSAGDDGAGFFSIVEPPWTAHYRSHTVDVNGAWCRVPFYYWYADQGALEKEYELIHCFVEKGSYSALAKIYRSRLQEQGRFKSFKEKVKEQPLNERVIGAPVFWLYSAKGPQSFVRIGEQMKADGIDRAILNLDPYYYDMLGLHSHAEEMEKVIAQLTEMGFIVSRYDQYRDTHPFVPDRIVYQQWNTSVYDRYAENYRGEKNSGFGPDSRIINPEAALRLAEENVAKNTERYPYNARFYDCFGIISPYLDSDFRAGQETGVRRVQEIRAGIFGTATSRGLLAGSEGGADWSLPHISWAEGSMSLMPASWGEIPGWGVDDENAHYKYQLDENIRIPFLQLVAGDCAVFSWRWEDGMDRKPQHWQKRNLLSVLYGGAPMFFINPDGYGALRPLIKYTYDYVCRWNQIIGGKEMLYHRALNADRSVQESCWDDGAGRLGVVVNFGSKIYREGTLLIPPNDYVMFEEVEGSRTYHSSIVPAQDCDFRTVDFSDTTEDFERGFAYFLRSDFSPDRGQFCGTVSSPDEVISGEFSMGVDNRNPKLPPFKFLTTKPELVPLQASETYRVSFSYRVLRAAPGAALLCRIGGEQPLAHWLLSEGGQKAVSFKVSPNLSGASIEWVLTGMGRMVVDDIRIEKTAGK